MLAVIYYNMRISWEVNRGHAASEVPLPPLPGIFEFVRTQRTQFRRLWEFARPHLMILALSTAMTFVSQMLSVYSGRARHLDVGVSVSVSMYVC